MIACSAMRNAILLLALLPHAALAAETVRCGTDDFGNTVCMDKNGIRVAVPAEWEVGKNGAVSTDGGKDDGKARIRCGIDPFGNKVCR